MIPGGGSNITGSLADFFDSTGECPACAKQITLMSDAGTPLGGDCTNCAQKYLVIGLVALAVWWML